MIEGIAKSGGVVGITAIDEFMMRSRTDVGRQVPRATLDRFLNEFDYMKKLVGADYVGIGPDFTYGANALIDPDNSFVFPHTMASRQQPIKYVKGFEVITELSNVEDGLRGRGWSQQDIDKVFGGNWIRVYEEAWED